MQIYHFDKSISLKTPTTRSSVACKFGAWEICALVVSIAERNDGHGTASWHILL